MRLHVRGRRTIALVAVVGLLLTEYGLARLPAAHASAPHTGAPHAAREQADLPTPPWWSGPCDLNNFQSATKNAVDRAGQAHPDGIASYSLGASYRGVTACGPRPLYDKTAPQDEPEVRIGGWGEYEWECTELVFRYMYLAFHQNAYSAWGASVVKNYPGTLLKKVNNDTSGQAPQPGDVISFGDPEHASASKPGHTAIIIPNDASHPAVNSDGNGYITILQQNTPQGFSPTQTIAVKNWHVGGVSGALPAANWLHDPTSDGGATQPPTGTTQTGQCVAPAINPTAARAIADVKLTTRFVDWTGNLAPLTGGTSFASDQAFVTAVRLGTSEAGELTVQDIFCSDGHSPPYDSATHHVNAGDGPGWIFQSIWVYAAAHPEDVGPVMETMSWNGEVGQVMFYTIRSTPVGPLACPKAPTTRVPGLAITPLSTANQVSQHDVSTVRISANYTGSAPATLAFDICIDGTTWQVSSTTLSSGKGDYSASLPMFQTSAWDNCISGECQLHGDARWYAVVNHHVVAQIPFTVTP